MKRYINHKLHTVHDIHYSWTGWPSAGSRFPPAASGIINELTEVFTSDRLSLESHSWNPDAIQLTVAALPNHAPAWISQRLKGRLDHALRKRGTPVAFSRKVSMRAIGHNRTGVVDRYVRDQLKHVDLADPRYRATLAEVAIYNPAVDLAEPAESSHGRYWYNLHVVFVVANRYRVGERSFLDRLRDRVMKASDEQGCALRRVSIMPDHMHVALRGNPALPPEEIALGLQNGSADAAGCRLWEHSFYVGTFGEYDKRTVMSRSP